MENELSMSQSSKPIPIAVPNDLLAKIELDSTKLGWSKQDTMREAMKLGLAHYERINWDIQGAVLDASAAKRNIVQMPQQQAPAMVAEDSQRSEAPAQASVNYKDALPRARRGNKQA